MVTPVDQTTPTPEMARHILAEERQRRQRECQTELQAVLEKYNCQLHAVPGITWDGRVTAEVKVLARE